MRFTGSVDAVHTQGFPLSLGTVLRFTKLIESIIQSTLNHHGILMRFTGSVDVIHTQGFPLSLGTVLRFTKLIEFTIQFTL